MDTARDGQDHHLLVILKIKIRSSQKCDLEDQNQDRDLEDHSYFSSLIVFLVVIPHLTTSVTILVVIL